MTRVPGAESGSVSTETGAVGSNEQSATEKSGWIEHLAIEAAPSVHRIHPLYCGIDVSQADCEGLRRGMETGKVLKSLKGCAYAQHSSVVAI